MTKQWESEIRDSEKGMWAIFPGLCKGCGLCIEKCPVKCILWSEGLGVYGTPRVAADMNKCIVCGICQMVCPDCAIRVEKVKK
jgi:2-oxoglutarate ferredoxin oxidoreductase subunit delta